MKRNNAQKIISLSVFALALGFFLSLNLAGCASTAGSAPAPAAEPRERLIELEGSYNFRDLGGYKTNDNKTVKWGLIYRGGDLSELTESDLQTLAGLNLKTVVDFRSAADAEKSPDKDLGGSVNHRNLGIDFGNLMQRLRSGGAGGADLMKTIYTEGIENTLDAYGEFFKIAADPANLPLAFHCSEGKDRTGIVSALFLSALGVDRETIFEDYLLSAGYVAGKFKPVVDRYPEFAPLMTVNREYLETAFSVIDKNYGGMDNYLRNHLGADPEALKRIYTE